MPEAVVRRRIRLAPPVLRHVRAWTLHVRAAVAAGLLLVPPPATQAQSLAGRATDAVPALTRRFSGA